MIRRATPSDHAALMTLINDVIAQPHITFRAAPKTDAEIEALIAGPAWVAERDSHIAGYAAYGPFRGSDGYRHTAEHSIAIADAAHGTGLGRALMSALEKAAQRDNIRTLVAGISGSNPAGIAFHTAVGFVPAGTLPNVGHKAGEWHDLIFMTKALAPVQSA